MIEKIECCHGTRTALDHLYEDVCQTIFSEMDKYLNVKNNNVTRTRRKLKIFKPLWNDELTCLWKDMRRHQIFLQTVQVIVISKQIYVRNISRFRNYWTKK